ncbi:PTS sugar transporter subunit IIA [Enterococcus sp. AZ072]|uniref:PTS sugar transporter subunit IIA n=1 Tax=unclassified Enterococcus TaxID=2608891 RepID=UPI003D267653
MSGIIDKRTIFLDSIFADKQSLLQDIADTAVELQITDQASEIFKELNDRENTLSTSVGKGIAIPHCKSNIVKNSKVFLYRLKEEIAWDDEENIKLAFAIITNNDSSDHLSILAKLSRNLLKDTFLNQIKEAKTSEEVFEKITSILD